MIPVIVNINRTAALWPHFIEHYAALGCDFIRAIAYGPNRHALADMLRAAPSPIPTEIIVGQDYEDYPAVWGATYQAIAELCRPGGWYVVADLDEFCEFPEPIPAMIDRAGDATYFPGVFVDRHARGGELVDVKPSPGVWAQFPYVSSVSRDVVKGCTDKVCLMRSPTIPASSGHHRAYSGRPFGQTFPVHHFKWTRGMIDELRRRAAWQSDLYSWAAEPRRVLEHVEANGGRVVCPMFRAGTPVLLA